MSTERIRLFVAATIPDDRLRLLDALVDPLRTKLVNARWTAVDNQHLTLKFLGSTPVDRLDAVIQTTTMVAHGHPRAELRFTELGAFPSQSRIRVLWMGVDDPAEALSTIARDLDRAFEPLGFPSEGRPYTPHLTLARFKLPVPLKSGFPVVDTTGIDPFSVDELTLFRSYLSPKRARYEVLQTFPLVSPG
ncbi:MAG: 2,3-cyclic 3-phosphodiesterase [Actinomycetota bacterium]|nr:2,3-cyclic 3-phosphodiesterase [Actinomycetota bacterium]